MIVVLFSESVHIPRRPDMSVSLHSPPSQSLVLILIPTSIYVETAAFTVYVSIGDEILTTYDD